MTHSARRHGLRDESGMALLISVIVLLLMSALALAALQHAGDEAVGSGSSRRKDATLYAAESGQSFVEKKLVDWFISGGLTDPNISLYNATDMALDNYGNPIEISVGPPESGGMPTAQKAVAATAGVAPKVLPGNDKKIQGRNSNNGSKPWPSDITTKDVGNGLTHLQVQFRVQEPGGY